MAEVVAVCISEKRGTKKHTVPYIELKINHGIVSDAHAGDWHRQVSLLSVESVDKMRTDTLNFGPGDFAENILTKGLELFTLPVGTLLSVGETTLEITQIGKKCHNDCEIKKIVGTCVMPTEGIFAKVIKEGRVYPRDNINVLEAKYETD